MRPRPTDTSSEPLLACTLERQGSLGVAVLEAMEELGLPFERVGLLLTGDTDMVLSMTRENLWRVAAEFELEVIPGLPRFFPVLVTLGPDVCFCWLGPLPLASASAEVS